MFRWLLVFAALCLSQVLYSEHCVLLDFETAWQRASGFAPIVSIAEAEIGVRKGERIQVGLLPNPVAIVEADNLGVSHVDDETEPPEVTFGIAQLIELGGKRTARKRFADSLTTLAALDAQIVRLDLRLQVTTLFIEASIAEERWKLSQEREALARSLLETTRIQVESGKFSPIQLKKVQMGWLSAQLAVKEALSAFNIAKQRLSALWGSDCPDFEGLLFDFSVCPPPPDICAVMDRLVLTPDYARARETVLSARKNLRLQKVNGIPDVTLSLGFRTFTDSSQHGWLVGIQMPLPFFDYNQGNVKRAYAGITQTESQLAEVVRDLTEKASVVHTQLSMAFDEIEVMRREIMEDASETCQLIQTGYENGKFDFRDVLEAQQIQCEIQERYLKNIYEYYISRAELMRLIGENLCVPF